MPKPTSLLKGFGRTIATIKPDPKRRITVADPDTRFLFLRVYPSGQKSLGILARDPHGKQVWATLGDAERMTLDEARDLVGECVARIKQGLDAFEKLEPVETPDSFSAVAENFLDRHVRRQGLRSAYEIERSFGKYILPTWKQRPFEDIRRGDVVRLLDHIEDNHGAAQADHCLSYLGKLFNWYAAREEDYSTPIVRGMRRTKPRSRSRDRILTDDEIRTLWPVMAEQGFFGPMLQISLLTAQRRAKVAEMKWTDIDLDTGVWEIATEAGEKSNASKLVLPALALDVIRAVPVIMGHDYIFAGRDGRPIGGFSKLKLRLDARVTGVNGEPLDNWTIHDVRRTAKSLMARAGVRPDISERVLGHTIGGVEGVYDRHTYHDEKADALERLAALVERIIDPPADNVVPITAEV